MGLLPEYGLENIARCEDTRVMADAIAKMPDRVDVGAAGTAMRFLTAKFCTVSGKRLITGSDRMKKRPIGPLVEALRKLGANVEYAEEEGFPPLCITGGLLHGGEVEIPANVSSQYVSALLMVAPRMKNGMTLKLVGKIISRPYIEMTLGLMKMLGADAEWTDGQTIRVEPGEYRHVTYRIENDWTASSYWYEMMALCEDKDAEIFLPGLTENSLQGDSILPRLFAPLGVQTTYTQEGVRLTKSTVTASRMDEDLTSTPDLAQTLVVTCVCLGIPFHFTGLESLKIKETDRMNALRIEMSKLGVTLVEEDGCALRWECPAHWRLNPQEGATMATYQDHRMAMSMAPICLKLGSIQIEHPEVVEKSYPLFWDNMQKMGFDLMRKEIL